MKQPFGNSLSPHAERLERLEHTMPAANVHGLMALGRSFGWEQQGGANHQKEERDGEWTAHDGMAFACHSIAGTARAPRSGGSSAPCWVHGTQPLGQEQFQAKEEEWHEPVPAGRQEGSSTLPRIRPSIWV